MTDDKISIFDDEYVSDAPVMNEETVDNDGEDCIISDDVIAIVAGKTATSLDSVASMSAGVAGDIAESLGVKNPQRGVAVKVDKDDNTVSIDLSVVVRYGKRFSDIAWEIQENVKRDVENLTGVIVQSVNVHIAGVDFGDNTKK